MGATAVRIAHDRLPRMHAYLRGLPEGLASYPGNESKCALVRSVANSVLADAADELPTSLAELVRAPPPLSGWVSQVHANALLIAARDLLFDDDAAFARHCYRAQRELFSSPIYALLMRCTSPARVLATAERRWHAFNRGCRLRAAVDGAHGSVWLEHPAGLFETNTRIALGEALRATLEMSRAQRVELRVHAIDASLTRVDMQW